MLELLSAGDATAAVMLFSLSGRVFAVSKGTYVDLVDPNPLGMIRHSKHAIIHQRNCNDRTLS